MAAQEEYGFGLIGCGVISDCHLQAIQRVPKARLRAVCDIIPERAQEKAQKYAAQAYTDLEEMVQRDDLDIVHVTTPSGHHHVAGIAAARAGKHVFVTKPIDITLENIDALIAACAENNVKLRAVHQFRSYASYRAVHDAVQQGRLGEIYYASVFVPWWRAQEYYTDRWQGTWALDGGGALMNQSVHWVDLLVWIMGDVAEVAGYVDTMAHDMETEDIGTAALKFRSGAHGIIQGTTLTYKGMATRLEVHGSKGNVEVKGDKVSQWDVEGEPSLAEARPEGETSAADPRAGLGDAVGAHAEQIEDLIAAIEENRAPTLSGQEARRAVELILAIYRSSQTGQKVKLPLTSPVEG